MSNLEPIDYVFDLTTTGYAAERNLRITILKNRFNNIMVSILEIGGVTSDRLQKGWYAVALSEKAMAWMRKAFVEGTDYYEIHSLKGVWVDVPEHILAFIKLKWA
jgi:hypothetical protein